MVLVTQTSQSGAGASGSSLTGVGSPEGVVNAAYIGQLYTNTVVNIDGGYDIYIAVTTTGKRQQIFVSPNS